MTIDRTRTTLVCACRRCGFRWAHDYDVVEWTDTDGEAVHWFSQHGIPVPSPFQHGSCCPRCQGLRVEVTPLRPGQERPSAGAGAAQHGDDDSGSTPVRTGRPGLPFGPPFPAC